MALSKKEIDRDRNINYSSNAGWFLAGIGLLIFLAVLMVGLANGEYIKIAEFIGGVVGPLWALSGLMFLYAAFLGQQKELELTKAEFEAHTAEFKNQNENIEKQNFESTLFNLLGFLKDNQLEFQTKMINKQFRGTERKEFRYTETGLRALDSHMSFFRSSLRGLPETSSDFKKEVGVIFNKVFENNNKYFVLFWQIIDFIEKSNRDKKEFYHSLLRGQISDLESEAILIYTSVISDSYSQGILLKFKYLDGLMEREDSGFFKRLLDLEK